MNRCWKHDHHTCKVFSTTTTTALVVEPITSFQMRHFHCMYSVFMIFCSCNLKLCWLYNLICIGRDRKEVDANFQTNIEIWWQRDRKLMASWSPFKKCWTMYMRVNEYRGRLISICIMKMKQFYRFVKFPETRPRHFYICRNKKKQDVQNLNKHCINKFRLRRSSFLKSTKNIRVLL